VQEGWSETDRLSGLQELLSRNLVLYNATTSLTSPSSSMCCWRGDDVYMPKELGASEFVKLSYALCIT
jgi:hypothetical protein